MSEKQSYTKCPNGCPVQVDEGETSCPFCDESKRADEIPRMTDAQLKKFVLGFCDGHIVCSAHPAFTKDPTLLRMVFLTLSLMPPGLQYKEEALKQIGLIWEYVREAGPRSINEMPSFLSHRLMHVDDWERARLAINAELDRRGNIKA